MRDIVSTFRSVSTESDQPHVQFSRAYEQVFGYPFTAKLMEEANEASRAATAGAAEVPLSEIVHDGSADSTVDGGSDHDTPNT